MTPLIMQAQLSDDDDVDDHVAVNVDGMGGFMEEFFEQVRYTDVMTLVMLHHFCLRLKRSSICR